MTDIVLVSYERPEFTKKTIAHIRSRTTSPYRIIQIDNGSKDQYFGGDIVVKLDKNYGLEVATNIARAFVTSDYFITIDSDILVPEMQDGDWILALQRAMNNHEDYAAIALRPQVLVGVGEIFKGMAEGHVVNNNVAGRSARIMDRRRTEEVGWWTNQFQNKGRGNEEWDICNKFKEKGWKVGYLNTYCYHMFGENWGYEEGKQPAHGIPESPKDVKYDPVTMIPEQKCNE